MWWWRRGLRWPRCRAQTRLVTKPNAVANQGVALLTASTSTIAAHRRRGHRAALRTRRRGSDHSKPRQQLSQVRAFVPSARSSAIRGNQRLERLTAIAAFVLKERHVVIVP